MPAPSASSAPQSSAAPIVIASSFLYMRGLHGADWPLSVSRLVVARVLVEIQVLDRIFHRAVAHHLEHDVGTCEVEVRRARANHIGGTGKVLVGLERIVALAIAMPPGALEDGYHVIIGEFVRRD